MEIKNMNLSSKQNQIVNTTENKVIVLAVAAAGKTAILVERVKTMLARGCAPEKMVVITFTTAAASEMSRRIGHVDGLFIGTIHAYAFYLLCAGGYHEQANKYVDEEKFDMLFTLIQRHPECIKPVEYLVVDEAQDVSENEWEFFDMLAPDGFFMVGDERQCIYTWRDVNIDDFKNRQNVSGTVVYELNENYRNSRDILNYAKWIISKTSDSPPDESMCMRGTRGIVDRIELNYEELVNIISESGTYDWFVLTRTNDQIAQVQYILDKYKIPNLTFKRGGKNFDELNELLHEPKVKVLTIHTAKGLECDNVIVIGANMWKDEEIRLSYVAATRARDHLIWMTQPKKKKGYFKAW